MGQLERWHDIKEIQSHTSIRGAAEWLVKNYLPRYVPIYDAIDGKRKKLTACNIFFTDMVQQMRIPGPYHWEDFRGNPLRWMNGVHAKGRELNANGLTDWFAKYGHGFGWTRASKEDAMKYAAEGKLVAVTWHSGTPKEPGHIAVLLDDGTIAQAGGGMPFVGKHISAGFGSRSVCYWAYVEPIKPRGT